MVFTVAAFVGEKVIAVWDDVAKVAVSVGTAAGAQLVAVFHSPVAGWVLQVDVLICFSSRGKGFVRSQQSINGVMQSK
jgi:hypothetical protein